MVYKGKHKIIDNYITACDYNFLSKKIKENITKKKTLLISPIASHTLVRAHYDEKLRKILDNFDYLIPDSQWVKRSIRFLYGKRLKERVYGPDLMLKTCLLAENNNLKIFLYGNTKTVLNKLKKRLKAKFPKLKIIADEPSKFRELGKKEWAEFVEKIKKTKLDIIFISLGSPKQEIFGYELSKMLKKPLIIIPTGAAFDFIAGHKPQAPKFIQNIGLEWLFRLSSEPVRLFTRYFFYGLLFIILIFTQKICKFNYRE